MIEPYEELLDSSNTKAKIFMTAARLFAERGYNGVSMREISEKTGLSKPAIYYHFGSKEGIYTALVDAGLHYQLEWFQKLIEKDEPILEKITEIVKARFRQVLDYPEFAKFFIVLHNSNEKLPFLERFVTEAEVRKDRLIELIREGIKRGEFGPTTSPELAAELFMASIIYFINKQLNSNQRILSSELAEQIVGLLFKGLNE